ncbi:hypothetical protein G7Y89_g11983 [Cudoniella acicularis]|uniref:F-box domain-containing protein n=1 Tax=Cudoniella acicularis TaxID=354080 RepID=A0A8H4RCQ0_9HELO|nr:hypothetical protein G7Y89_g11983 [Cudoniella acicularis]
MEVCMEKIPESAAAQRVLATPELLSIILSYLSPKALILSASLVSRIWHDILCSPDKDLRTALFLRSASPETFLEGEYDYNDLLQSLFQTPEGKNGSPKPIFLDDLPWKTNPEAWKRSEGLWRNMLVVQPPCTRLAISKDTLSSRDFPRTSGISGSIECPAGLTFGLLYDIVVDWERVARDPDAAGRIQPNQNQTCLLSSSSEVAVASVQYFPHFSWTSISRHGKGDIRESDWRCDSDVVFEWSSYLRSAVPDRTDVLSFSEVILKTIIVANLNPLFAGLDLCRNRKTPDTQNEFYSYNVMSLNILFWAVTLFVGAWGIRSNWLGDWYDRVPTISKVFTILYPIVVVGLMQLEGVINSVPVFFIVSNFTLLISMAIGTVLLILILYKYMKTRRLVAGSNQQRGRWWASGSSKERSQNDIGTNGTMESGIGSNTRRSIYDRALVTRFTIGFGILVLFEIAIIVFNLFQLSNNASIAASGGPNLNPNSAITDIVFFIPGVTTSLVAFLVFGTTKSWRQYRDLVLGGCGLKRKILSKRRQRDEEANPDQSLEFQRLPSITHRPSEEERQRGQELESRVKMFARESCVSEVTDFAESVHTADPSISTRSEGQSAKFVQFHRSMPSASLSRSAKSIASSKASEIGVSISSDPVIQRGVEEYREPRRFVKPRPTSQTPTNFLEDSSD